MRRPANTPCHQCAPKEWRSTPNITGSYELDASIMHNPNADVPARLSYYADNPSNAYSPKTGYSGYHNYHGDT